MSQGTSVVIARPDDSTDVPVKAHMAVDDHAEELPLRRDCDIDYGQQHSSSRHTDRITK